MKRLDASGTGFGGVLLQCTQWLPPMVWRVKMPKDLIEQVTNGTLTRVDCEHATYFLGNGLLHNMERDSSVKDPQCKFTVRAKKVSPYHVTA